MKKSVTPSFELPGRTMSLAFSRWIIYPPPHIKKNMTVLESCLYDGSTKSGIINF